METKGLLDVPRFDDPEYYLTSGEKTQITPLIQEVADRARGKTDLELAQNMLSVMCDVTDSTRGEGPYGLDYERFKKTADTILKNGKRTGSVDAVTLYASLLRARGIPAMQILTLHVPSAIDHLDWFTEGYMYSACFLKDEEGRGAWYTVNSGVSKLALSWTKFKPLNTEDRNIEPDLYAFAYTRDYSDINYKGVRINSEQRMKELQRLAYGYCNKYDMAYVQTYLKDREERRKREAEERTKKEAVKAKKPINPGQERE